MPAGRPTEMYLFRTDDGVWPPVADEASASLAAQWHDIRHRIREHYMDVPVPRPANVVRLIPKLDDTFFNRYWHGADFVRVPDRWEVRVGWKAQVV